MKVVILCGGLGTRLANETKTKPKPMVKIGDKPIIWHLIKYYSYFGFKEFILATGYKYKILEDFFKKNKINGLNIKLVYTGKETLTGGRILRLKNEIGKKDFLLTYGDGLSNVNLKKLLIHHKKKGGIVTLTAVRPSIRFGELKKGLKTITQQMLSKQLKELEGDGIINRNVIRIMPPKVEYSLTEFGFSVMPILRSFSEWNKRNTRTISVKLNKNFEENRIR